MVPSKKQNELGRLSNSFNTMTMMIKKMIKAKEQLLLDVSHELRSPLTRMKVNLEFIEDQKVKQSLYEDIREMEQMIREILESEKIDHAAETISFEQVDIAEMVKEAAELFSQETPSPHATDHRISIDPANCSVMVNSNPMRIKILFRNIIENALRFSENKPVHIEIREDTQNVVITVTDQGQGISEKALPFIFEPFYRADSSRSRETGGYGLGMYLCKKIANLHRGDIKIKSKAGKGTSVVVTLPKMNTR